MTSCCADAGKARSCGGAGNTPDRGSSGWRPGGSGSPSMPTASSEVQLTDVQRALEIGRLLVVADGVVVDRHCAGRTLGAGHGDDQAAQALGIAPVVADSGPAGFSRFRAACRRSCDVRSFGLFAGRAGMLNLRGKCLCQRPAREPGVARANGLGQRQGQWPFADLSGRPRKQRQ